jgi:hypothetical protein
MSNPHLEGPRITSDDSRRAFLRGDREDLLAVLTLRFGGAPESVKARITACDDAATLERWILVAANVPDWDSFLSELDAGPQAFKLVGARYEPTAAPTREPREPREPQSSRGAHPKEE